MAYLVDTNIWLERLLDQERSEEVGRFLDGAGPGELFISDFTLHSIAVVLSRLNRVRVLLEFVEDLFGGEALGVVRLLPRDLPGVIDHMEEFGPDFDDAYQYCAASKYHLGLLSFDSDFDRTPRGRKTPGDILAS